MGNKLSPADEAELTHLHEEAAKRAAGVDAAKASVLEYEKGTEVIPIGFHGKAAKIIMECAQSGEPVFVLRAKDLLSVLAATEYLNLVEKYGLDPEIQEGVHTAISTMMEWQRANPGLVRLPD